MTRSATDCAAIYGAISQNETTRPRCARRSAVSDRVRSPVNRHTTITLARPSTALPNGHRYLLAHAPGQLPSRGFVDRAAGACPVPHSGYGATALPVAVNTASPAPNSSANSGRVSENTDARPTGREATSPQSRRHAKCAETVARANPTSSVRSTTRAAPVASRRTIANRAGSPNDRNNAAADANSIRHSSTLEVVIVIERWQQRPSGAQAACAI